MPALMRNYVCRYIAKGTQMLVTFESWQTISFNSLWDEIQLYISAAAILVTKIARPYRSYQKLPLPGNAEIRTHLTKHFTTSALPYCGPPFLLFSQSTSSVSRAPLPVCDRHSWCAFDTHAIRATLHCSRVLSFACCSCTVPPSAKFVCVYS